jgi:hypothetical protein
MFCKFNKNAKCAATTTPGVIWIVKNCAGIATIDQSSIQALRQIEGLRILVEPCDYLHANLRLPASIRLLIDNTGNSIAEPFCGSGTGS